MREYHDAIDGMKKGDWVRFCRNNELIIGQVEYLWMDGKFKFAGTDKGPVNIDSILEWREGD